MLERNLRLAGFKSRVEIARGGLTAQPFSDATVNALSVHARVLKPGGRFLLIVWVPGWMMFAIANVLSFGLASRAWCAMATEARFAIADGTWFLVPRKPES